MVSKKWGFCLVVLLVLAAAAGCGRAAQPAPAPQPASGHGQQAPEPALPEGAITYTDGVYEGKGQGFKGEISIEVTINGGAIVNIEIVDSIETASIGDAAYEELVRQAISAQDAKIDGVSGATATSQGFAEALRDALGQARR